MSPGSNSSSGNNLVETGKNQNSTPIFACHVFESNTTAEDVSITVMCVTQWKILLPCLLHWKILLCGMASQECVTFNGN